MMPSRSLVLIADTLEAFIDRRGALTLPSSEARELVVSLRDLSREISSGERVAVDRPPDLHDETVRSDRLPSGPTVAPDRPQLRLVK